MAGKQSHCAGTKSSNRLLGDKSQLPDLGAGATDSVHKGMNYLNSTEISISFPVIKCFP